MDTGTIMFMDSKERTGPAIMNSASRRGISVSWAWVLGLVVVALVTNTPQSAAGQSEQQPDVPAHPLATPVAQNIPIGPGDLIDVEVFNTPELSARLRVDQSGEVALPLGGDVAVGGMKVADAAHAIEQIFRSKQIMLEPTVMVSILEYATEGVTVLGEVRTPGIYTLLGPHSLYDALASAGGVLSSEGSTITISHANDAEHPVVIPVTTADYSAIQKSALIRPGDTVMVSKAALIYAVGDLVHSGAFYLESGRPMTVLGVLALAQGFNRTARVSRSALIRTNPDGSVIRIDLDLNKVMASKVPDLRLNAGDVLVVPRSGLKSLGITALPGLTSAVSSAVSTALITH